MEIGHREYADLVCAVCGGYGVLMGGTTDPLVTFPCSDCEGTGHGLRLVEFWENWQPDQAVLDLIARACPSKPT